MTMPQPTYRSVALGLGVMQMLVAAACQRSERKVPDAAPASASAPTRAPLPPAPRFTSVTGQMLLDAGRDASHAANWVMYGGAYTNQRYSVLDQIDKSNVKSLALAWTYKTGVPLSFETTPVVVDGVMYMTTADSKVIALNAATGEQMW